MKSKKILAGFCASLMLAAASIPSVSAADAVKVKVGSAEAKAGDSFTVAVELSDIPAAGINACDFGIEYDKSVITITDVTTGALAKEDSTKLEGVEPLEVGLEDGFASIVYALSSNEVITGSGVFLNVTGTVKSTAKSGDKSDLKIVAVDRNETATSTTANADIIFGNLGSDNTTAVNYTPEITNGVITVIGDETQPGTEQGVTDPDPVEASLRGDVDCNGIAGTSADCTLLAKYIANKSKYALDSQGFANADVDTEKGVTTSDLAFLIEVMLEKRTL